MQNVSALKILINKHFRISKKAKLSIGITHKGEKTKYYMSSNDEVSEEQIVYGAGSISKTLIATYLSKMLSNKKIALDDTLDKYFKVKSNKVYPTILSLATHTSGYSKFIPFLKMTTSLALHGFCRKNFYGNIKNDWIDQKISKIPFNHKRGYHYSDFNYAVLGRIIEIIEKDSLDNIMDNFLRIDIGMKNTKYISENDKLEYSWNWNEGNPFRASGGISTTIDDMILFIEYQLNPINDFLSYSFDKYYLEKENIYTGFSWNSFKGGKFYWHHGAMGYFRSSIIIDRKRNIGVIVMSTIKGGRIQRMGSITSQIYRNMKRNPSLLYEFLDGFITDEAKYF